MKKKQTIQEIVIAEEHNTMELAIYIKKILGISNRQSQKIIRTKGLILNGRPVHSKTKLASGDYLEIKLPKAEQVKIPIASSQGLVILYEDEWILGVDKPIGIPTYAVKGKHGLANMVAGYYQNQNLKLTPRPLHRLDTPTSGVVLFAKDAITQTSMGKLWAQYKVRRFYRAICQGQILETLNIKIPLDKTSAHTKVIPLKVHENFTELEIELITGRSHQIRRHLAWSGHALIGDRRYGKGQKKSTRLALHASCVRFPHPYKNNEILEISSEVPNLLLP